MPGVTLPASGTFNATNTTIDINGRANRTLYAWGDFGGGRLIVQAVIPHPDGDEIFDMEDFLPQSTQDPQSPEPLEDPEVIEPESREDEPPPLTLEMNDRGWIQFNLDCPIIRLSMVDWDAPDMEVRYWVG